MTSWDVVAQIREARGGANRLHGRPLYAYRLSAREFDQLRSSLAQDLRGSSEMNRRVAGAFCLFAAEFVRREFDGSVWSWEPILGALQLEDTTITSSYEMLERCLRDDFGIDLLRGRRAGNPGAREFLLTLMCQGGLPLALLRREQSYLLRYFRWLLDERARADARRSTSELAAEARELLPRSLRNAVVFQLASDLTDAIARLRAQLTANGDPVAQLDRVDPLWRERVPLSLDDVAARALLAELLLHVRRQSSVRAGLRIVTVLRRMSSRAIRLERRALLLGRHTRKQLAELFGQADLPLRFFIDMLSADGARQHVGTAQLVAGDSEYEVVDLGSRPLSHPEAVVGEVLLLARTATEDLGVFEPEGGQALGNVPWWFTDEAGRDEQRLVGQADVVTRRESLLVVLPRGVTVEPAGAHLIGTLDEPPATIHRAQGAYTWRSDDDKGAARVGAPEDIAPVTLLGDVRLAFTARHTAWYGAPVLATRDGAPTAAALEWHASDGSWARAGDSCLGRVALRAIHDGATLLRTTTTVVPRDLTLESEPGEGSGTLRVRSRKLRGMSVEACPVSLQTSIVQGDGVAEVHVVANDSADLTVRLSFDGGGSAVVSAPLPVIAARFVDRRGEPLPADDSVSAHRLHGVRARVVTPHDRGAPMLFARRLLKGEAPSRAQPIAVLRVTRDPHTFELPLDDARESILEHLAVGSHPDDYVELALGTGSGPRIRVRRHEAAFHPGSPGSPVRKLTLPTGGSTALEPRVADALEVSLLQIADPAASEIPLSRNSDGSWHFVAADHAPGCWLVIARYGNAVRLRPVLITNRPDEIPVQEPGSLDHALLCARRDERSQLMSAYFARLETGFAAADWTRIQAFVDTVGPLPAPTFDVVARIASQRVLAAYALLKAADGAFGRVWNGFEELPFMWHLLPVAAWVRAARTLYSARRHEVAALKKLGIDLSLPDPLRHWGANPFARFLEVLHDLFVATVMDVEAPKTAWVRDARDPTVRSNTIERLMHGCVALESGVRTEVADDLTTPLSPEGAAVHALDQLRDIVHRDGSRSRAASAGTFLRDFGARVDATPTPAARVAYAAAITAAYAYSGERASHDLLFRLRGYRRAAYELFDLAHATYLTLLLGARLEMDKEYLDDV